MRAVHFTLAFKHSLFLSGDPDNESKTIEAAGSVPFRGGVES